MIMLIKFTMQNDKFKKRARGNSEVGAVVVSMDEHLENETSAKKHGRTLQIIP